MICVIGMAGHHEVSSEYIGNHLAGCGVSRTSLCLFFV